eukprot:CAMPEP_0119276056 /NCGR_PEP_ID=MMETSP1329-20130426/14778_1 /TAXON_ID=114041 /ORGANISM="Genus nov. species nov., Strain RCC1024" /LENGTH=174 /DNA_ID=CAMNT_0007276477 /DNA_START=18 /DNA_END=539 /DNA_ORIENTATION=+
MTEQMAERADDDATVGTVDTAETLPEPAAVAIGPSPPPPELAAEATQWRVKVYRLNPEGQWDDCGTGRVALVAAPPAVVVHSEAEVDGQRELLLTSRLAPSHDAYGRQGENIITWDTRRGDSGSAIAERVASGDSACVALSFQEKHGCDDVFARLQTAAARLIDVLSKARSRSP